MAQKQGISQKVAIGDPGSPDHVLKPNADGSINVSGGGGASAATAAANGTVAVVAGTNKPQAIDLFSSTSVQIKDATGTAFGTVGNPLAVSGSFSAGPTATASAAALAVVAGTSKPQNIDLFSQTRVIVGDATGTAIDWTAPVPVTQSGTWNITNVSGTVSLPTGAATEASLVKIPLAQGSTTAGQSGGLMQGAVTTAAPSYTTAQTSPLSLTTGGALRVDTALTTIVVTQATASSLNAQAVGNVAGAAADSGNPVKIGGVYTTAGSQPTYTTGNRTDLQTGSRGSLSVQVMAADATTTQAILTSASDGDAVARAGFYSYARPQVYNGIPATETANTFFRSRGDTTGAATVPYGITSARWSYAAAASGIVNTTTAVTIKASAGAGLRNCLVSCNVYAEALGAATELAIRDGAAGTVLWRIKIPTTGMPLTNITFPAAIAGTAATLLEVVTLTASVTGAVYFNATGNIEV